MNKRICKTLKILGLIFLWLTQGALIGQLFTLLPDYSKEDCPGYAKTDIEQFWLGFIGCNLVALITLDIFWIWFVGWLITGRNGFKILLEWIRGDKE